MTDKQVSQAQNSPVYTIGHRESYIKGLAENGDKFLKTGKYPARDEHPCYPGGIIFRTPEDARQYINEELTPEDGPLYAIWEIDANWYTDCQSDDKSKYWKSLQLDSRIVCMVVE